MRGFPSALSIVLKHEGALSDHPEDPGGITLKGISLRFLKAIGFDANQDGQVNREDVLGLTDNQIAQLYRERFWNVCRCNKMPYPIALCVFDSGVNQGVGTAAKLLQKTVYASPDGAIGPKTLAALARHPVSDVVLEFMARRCLRYAYTRGLKSFGRGWFRRVLEVYRATSEA